jgi:EAL domain-containing protein (putative c-di-GMP-specific phosphodiesterase class I)
MWALPADPPAPGGARRWLLVGTALALAVVPPALVGDDANTSTALAASLSITALAGLAAAASLQLQSRSAGDGRLRWAAAGFGAVPVLAVLRAASLKTGGVDVDVEPVLALLQALAVPLAVLLGLRAQASRAPAAVAVVAAPALAAPVVVGALLRDGTAATSLRALELAVAVVATVAVLAWVRQSPAPSRHGHGWVSAGLVLTVLGCVGRSLASERTGSAWSAAVVVTDLGVVVPALGLGLVTGRRYRRQLKRWRYLQAQVQAARASSPLLPGLSVSPDEDAGLPGSEQIDRVLAAGRVGIALQPVVAPGSGALLGAEALARFGGPMPPDRWFRAARRDGTGVALELLALRSALAYQHTLPDDAFLAVNLSPAALADDDVLVALRGCDLDRLVLEITEHEAVRDYPAARARLEALRTLGARTAVDDTGAGFASLRHVLQLQPDIIKLDRTLTVGVDHDQRQRGLVAALVGLAEEVGVLLIAEGVEDAEQQRALVALRLPAAQGYHLGMPVLQEPLVERPG